MSGQEPQRIEKRLQLLEQLCTEQPKLYVHPAGTPDEGREEAWPLGVEFLRWIIEHLPEQAHTLETGCGYSTLTLAFCGARHIAIAPDYEQHGRIKGWCHDHGIPVDQLTMMDAPSQDVLPTLETGALDLVLIDGCHAFPAPFLDWYYTAEQIRPGGWLIVDDCHIVTGRMLADFLDADSARWQVSLRSFKTIIYQRISSEPVVKGLEWTDQPYCSTVLREPSPTLLGRILNRGRAWVARNRS